MINLLTEARVYQSCLHTRSRPGSCATCASRTLHLDPSHSSFRAGRDARIDAGLQSMHAAAGFVVVCHRIRLRSRGSVVGVRSRQRAQAGITKLRARGEQSVAAFEILGVAVMAVGCISTAVIEHRSRPVVG